jgi:hypothetical protein
MLKSVCVLFSVLCVASPAYAEVFKCVGKYGEALYQNFPCQFESMGSVPVDAPGSKKPSALPTETRLGMGSKKLPALPAEPRVGMTNDEVRAIWGEPTEIIQEEPGEGSRFEVWSYDASRSVRFDRKRRVSSVQK